MTTWEGNSGEEWRLGIGRGCPQAECEQAGLSVHWELGPLVASVLEKDTGMVGRGGGGKGGNYYSSL